MSSPPSSPPPAPPPPPTAPLPPTSSSIIANNDDILTQLLVCLPNKSLHRFRCASKQWCSLISGNYFIQKRSSRKYRHRSINGLFLHRWLDSRITDNTWKFDFISIDSNVRESIMPSKTLSFTNDIGGIQIEQSCNGLLLCSTFKLYNFNTRSFNPSAQNYYIYNPTTEQYTILPRFVDRKYSFRPGFCVSFSVSLAFNPIKSPHYKVIGMLRTLKNDYEINIYSSETCTWKVVAHSHALPNICGSGVFWNGLLNWHNVDGSLVYFDIEKEVFGSAPMPHLAEFHTSLYFGECKGHLYYIELSDDWVISDPSILIYERHYSTGWCYKCRISFRSLRELFHKKVGYYIKRFDVKVLLLDGEEIKEEYESPKLVLLIRDKVLSFDLGDWSMNEIHDIEVPAVFVAQLFFPLLPKVIHAYQYIKTFASV